MYTKEIIELDKKFIINTYGERSLLIVRGRGMQVWDAEGKEYLDFFSGIGVNILGHCHPGIISAIKEQSEKFIHISNLYYNEPQVRLAELLTERFNGKCFFTNSGAEANEAAIKLVRKYYQGLSRACKKRYKIITMKDSFHGRTLASLAATGQRKHQNGFSPLPSGFKYVPLNDIDAVSAAIDEETAAVMVEPIQGEGGNNVASNDYLHFLRMLCNKERIILIFDEIQCGLGRTGEFFAYEHAGVIPDILTLAKPIGGGLPLGAMLARDEIANAFLPGNHASTFGGNPVSCAAGVALIETIMKENLLENAIVMGDYLFKKLNLLKEKNPFIVEIRGRKLMIGMELAFGGMEVVRQCLLNGLLINCTAENFIRFLPPLIITRNEIDKALSILGPILKEVQAQGSKGE
ncbi:aspartate aminotransferase family protein [candidate division NPL-UPA2 bacterium Unc8]|uniref:Acetylornithine aminotransferase n=1 Tax=candidate division NPL-UPA2 bacterium Unc8 TaxID=1980939 RepID=A0A399FXV4_UNCN2|nr:Acetylornithine aminotransferase [Bacillota bacterium]MBT9137755.1 Acetylornithine aminotransferase [Bacillota bacterium]MBT9146307.1 Acetylornithine aminotransferase [Bacillota bacterium]RII00269.1 MAG: aspartate aminotransferase family protein [candidate division NPL-UPA2 bacterium Unc8]